MTSPVSSPGAAVLPSLVGVTSGSSIVPQAGPCLLPAASRGARPPHICSGSPWHLSPPELLAEWIMTGASSLPHLTPSRIALPHTRCP